MTRNKTTKEKKPLFVPLKTEYFEAFVSGAKQEEFRPLGRGWNQRTCFAGRPVTISKGYGKKYRRDGFIIGVRIVDEPNDLPGWVECYGKHRAPCIAIKIHLHP